MLSALRAEADNAIIRAELAEEKNKKYEQLIVNQDQTIADLEHKVSVLDNELEKSKAVIAKAELKQSQEQREASSHNDLMRKIQLLEEELEAAQMSMQGALERSDYRILDRLR